MNVTTRLLNIVRLRPELPEALLYVKICDNGILVSVHHFFLRGEDVSDEGDNDGDNNVIENGSGSFMGEGTRRNAIAP